MNGILATKYTPKALLASGVIKASSGALYGLIGYNSKASAQYIQVFDLAAVPADAAVPEIVFVVPAQSNFSLSFDNLRFPCVNGICWSNSSTLATKTIGSADVWMTALYD